MGNSVWSFGSNVEKIAYQYLVEYASKLKEDTDNMIDGSVTETINKETGEIVYALYLVVPGLRNYAYRLIEVIQNDIATAYPVTMKLFGSAHGNIIKKDNISKDDFEQNLLDLINNPLTKLILNNLRTLLEIKQEYNQ